jgi:hypothetical protein
LPTCGRLPIGLAGFPQIDRQVGRDEFTGTHSTHGELTLLGLRGRLPGGVAQHVEIIGSVSNRDLVGALKLDRVFAESSLALLKSRSAPGASENI